MDGINTGIQLQDRFTPVIFTMTNAIRTCISACESLNTASGAAINTEQFNIARAALRGVESQLVSLASGANSATREAGRLQNELNRIQNSQGAPKWTRDNMQIFTNSGVERFRQEAASADAMLRRIITTQTQIRMQANRMEIVPDGMQDDLTSLNSRLSALRTNIQRIENNPLNLGTEEANNGLEYMRSMMSELMSEQSRLNNAMANMDVQSANNSYLNLSRTIATMERYIRNNTDAQGRFNTLVNQANWTRNNMQIFTNSGVERFRQEVASANSMLQRLATTQLQVNQNAQRLNVIPNGMQEDLISINNRINTLRSNIQRIERNRLNLGTAEANSGLEHMRSMLAQMITQQNQLNRAMANMDVAAANRAYLELSNIIGNTERYIRDNTDEQGRFNNLISQGNTKANTLVSTLKRAVSAYVGLQGIKNVVSLSDNNASTTARMNLINDGTQSTDELKNKVYEAAQRSRSDYMGMSSTVTKLALQAEKSFSSNDEVIAFTELMNKNFVVGGSSATEQSAAMYQLTQAMSAGKLQGDEFRSIRENAPLLASAIEDYMINVQKAEGSMKEWAAEGLLTTDVIKNAVFSTADQINTQFEQMPLTWGQLATKAKNRFVKEFEPALKKVNELANNESVQNFINNIFSGLAAFGNLAADVFETVAKGGNFIVEHWDGISKILGIAAAAMTGYALATGIAAVGQWALNAAASWGGLISLISPAGLLAIAFAAVAWAINRVVETYNELYDANVSTTGYICACLNVVRVLLVNCGKELINSGIGVMNGYKAVAYNIQLAFKNAINFSKVQFYTLASVALTVISRIANALNKLPFVEFDATGIATSASEYAKKASSALGKIDNNYKDVEDEIWKGINTYDTFGDGWQYDAWNQGYDWGSGLGNKVKNLFNNTEKSTESGFDYSRVTDAIANAQDTGDGIKADTGAIKDTLNTSEEHLKYLIDFAEREVIDRTVLKNVSIDMSGMVNKVENVQDLDGITTRLEKELRKQMAVSMEGA